MSSVQTQTMHSKEPPQPCLRKLQSPQCMQKETHNCLLSSHSKSSSNMNGRCLVGSLWLCSQISTVNKIIFKKAHITCLKENIEYFKKGKQKQTKLAMVETLINASGVQAAGAHAPLTGKQTNTFPSMPLQCSDLTLSDNEQATADHDGGSLFPFHDAAWCRLLLLLSL